MVIKAEETAYFNVGGTLHRNAPSYVKRPADEKLFEQLLAGRFCYILTSRQMGKSSLMLRTADRLRQRGRRTAIVDLSSLGTDQVTSEQWYLGLITRIGVELNLAVDAKQWWHVRAGLPSVQRFTDFLHDVVLATIDSQIVIFIDEIDSTLKLSFTDDFFAAIRFVYNQRANHSEYERLTFALLGVASPTDLIRDRNRTPFNIGQAIDLQELSLTDAQPLQTGLEKMYPGQGKQILDRIFYWTNGHPFLTQKLCQQMSNVVPSPNPDSVVDQLVADLFFTEEAGKDDNLQFIRSYVEANSNRNKLMQLYKQVYTGKRIKEDERSSLQQWLKLIGLVRVENQVLQVRNEIYRRVFDLVWIRENMTFNVAQLITIGAICVILLVSGFLYLFLRWQAQQQIETTTQTYIERFERSPDPDIRLNSLAGLCRLEKYDQAHQLFFGLAYQEQKKIFDTVEARGAGHQLVEVVTCLHPLLIERTGLNDQREGLSKAMCCALYRFKEEEGWHFHQQLGYDCGCVGTGDYD